MPEHWFEAVADHLGPAYLRYSFTKGTANEVAFLAEALDLQPGMRLLDVGCGPGRHAHAIGALGVEVVGVDIAQRFVDVARTTDTPGVSFRRLDARELPFDAEFDAVISLCQGAFGLAGGPGELLDRDVDIVGGMARALRPGGRLALSAFSSYFQIRYLEEFDTFDADRGVNHELATLRDADGVEIQRDLWTTCFTPRELRLLARASGLEPLAIHAVTPGAYAARPPDLDHPELLLLAARSELPEGPETL